MLFFDTMEFFFGAMDLFFIINILIIFLLIILMCYVFKQRIVNLEEKNDTMFDILNTMLKEINVIRCNIFSGFQHKTQESQCEDVKMTYDLGDDSLLINGYSTKSVENTDYTIKNAGIISNIDESDNEDDNADDNADDDEDDYDDEEEDVDEDGVEDNIEICHLLDINTDTNISMKTNSLDENSPPILFENFTEIYCDVNDNFKMELEIDNKAKDITDNNIILESGKEDMEEHDSSVKEDIEEHDSLVKEDMGEPNSLLKENMGEPNSLLKENMGEPNLLLKENMEIIDFPINGIFEDADNTSFQLKLDTLDDDAVSVFSDFDKSGITSSNTKTYNKMSVSMLKTLASSKFEGIDVSKLKKQELVRMMEEEQHVIT